MSHRDVVKWHDFVTSFGCKEGKRILLFTPCAAVKPYKNSETYRIILPTLEKTGLRPKIHVVAISEPLALEPEEYWNSYPVANYDCAGLFRDFVQSKELAWSHRDFAKCMQELSEIVARYLIATKKCYDRRFAFVRSNHELIVKKAVERSGIHVRVIPNAIEKKRLIAQVGFGKYCFRGLRLPEANRLLSKVLTR